MNDVDIESLLYRIFNKKLIFFYKTERYELISPDISLRYEAQILYDHIINEEKFNDWIRQDYIDNLLINLGLWTHSTENMIKTLDKKIEDTKVDLFQNCLLQAKCKTIRKNLESLKNQYNKIMSHKYEMIGNTLEGYASGSKQEYIICNTLYKNNRLVFDYKNNNNNQNSYLFFNELLNEINKHNINIDTYKKIARHNIWRGYWNCGKENIFPDSNTNWTEEQRSLVNITVMYDNVYNHPECPSDAVIEDDDMLDGWMIHQRRKTEKSKKVDQIDKLNPKLKNANEVFIMSTAEEAKDIMELNTEEAKNRIKNKFTTIDKANSPINEFDLPDVKAEIAKGNMIRKIN